MGLKNNTAARSIVILVVMGFFALFGIPDIPKNLFETKKVSECSGRNFASSREQLDCILPYPPIGRWKAVYTKEFAQSHHLPPENISKDMSPGVDYMEMDVQPYGEHGTACLVNMLIKRPNDVAFYNGREREYVWAEKLHEQRKLAHFLDLDSHKKDLRTVTSFGLSGRIKRYDPDIGYSLGSTFAFYIENIFDNYDYVTANAECRPILSSVKGFPDKWALNYAKASVWGKYERQFTSMNDPRYPKDKDFFDSMGFFNIPRELIASVFEGMPIGGR